HSSARRAVSSMRTRRGRGRAVDRTGGSRSPATATSIREAAPTGLVRVTAPAPNSPQTKGIPDLVGPDLRVLFCGINPGSLSGELGLHFARRGNRFWKLLHFGGFTESVL